MRTVYANTRSILHRGDGLVQTSGPPDVCKTPTPGGPVPIPYPNIAQDSDLSKGTKTVLIEGNPAANAGSALRVSTGNEPGTAGGGIISSKIKGKLTFGSSSPDVVIEGKGAVRFLDVTQHNGNAFNSVSKAPGALTTVDYGGDPLDQEDCLICGEPKSKHTLVASNDLVAKVTQLRDALKKDEKFAEVFVRRNGRPLKPTFVIGVLSCQCEDRKQYAGISGHYFDGNHLKSANEFARIAGDLKLEPVFAVPKPDSLPLSGSVPPSGEGGFGALTAAQRDAAGERLAGLGKDEALKTTGPMICAAPKMVQQCLRDGHKPGNMVEMLVAFPDPGKELKQLEIERLFDRGPNPPKWLKPEDKATSFSDGDVVPSCVTCQVLLTEMLCYAGEPPCP